MLFICLITIGSKKKFKDEDVIVVNPFVRTNLILDYVMTLNCMEYLPTLETTTHCCLQLNHIGNPLCTRQSKGSGILQYWGIIGKGLIQYPQFKYGIFEMNESYIYMSNSEDDESSNSSNKSSFVIDDADNHDIEHHEEESEQSDINNDKDEDDDENEDDDNENKNEDEQQSNEDENDNDGDDENEDDDNGNKNEDEQQSNEDDENNNENEDKGDDNDNKMDVDSNQVDEDENIARQLHNTMNKPRLRRNRNNNKKRLSS